MRAGRTWILVAATLAPGALAGACSTAPQEVYTCTYPITGRKDAKGQPDPCCEGTPCPGHCLTEPCPDGSTPDGSTPDGP